MPRFRTSTVSEILAERPGIQRVALDDGGRAYSITALVGSVAVGDEVVVNTTAVDLGLGTGGWHVVHWNLSRRSLDLPGGGHIMKVRYTSLQADTGAAEEHLAPVEGREPLPHLHGVPVVVCSLHSQVGVVAAAVAASRPGTRVVYVMTDGAALPLALSDLVYELGRRGLLAATVTAGHAFGGDLEAVSIPSGLQLAVEQLGAEVIIVGMGPGVVGTGRALGTTSVEVAAIVDAVDALGGRPVVAVRASSADLRERHHGLSHHSVTALRLARVAAEVPVPAGAAGDAVADLVPEGHVVARVAVPDDASSLLGDLRVTTMGRGPEQDPLFFACAAAAGVHAVRSLPAPDTVAEP